MHLKKGGYTISALKTNHVIYPCGIKQAINQFALLLLPLSPLTNEITLFTVMKANGKCSCFIMLSKECVSFFESTASVH